MRLLPVCGTCIFVLFSCDTTDVKSGEELSESVAQKLVEEAWECAEDKDHLCAFERSEKVLSSPEYNSLLKLGDSHSYTTEWEWYSRVAFDAAENQNSEDKRRIAETAIGTLRFLYGYDSEDALKLHLQRAEACRVLIVGECVQSSRRYLVDAVLYSENSRGEIQVNISDWYAPYSEGAPTIENIKGRVQSVLLLKE